MKLSKHGCKNFGYHEAIGLGIGSYDFQQEDFVGGVVLTVDEAKDLRDTFLTLCEIADVNENSSLNFKNLVKQIEQAEMSKQST